MKSVFLAAIFASLLWATPSLAQQTFKVSGKVLTSSGEPLRGRDLVISISHDRENGFEDTTCPMEEDGTFHCELPPGRYLFSTGPALRPEGSTGPLAERGIVPVTVRRADVSAVVIQTRPPVRVRGHVRFDADMANAIRPSINLFATPAFDGLGIGGHEAGALSAADGSFELLVAAVPVVIRSGSSAVPSERNNTWWPGPVLLDGHDITDIPTDFSKTDGELEVVFTPRPTGVFGIAREEATDLPAENASVVVFSAEPSQRQPWASSSQLLQTDSNGRFWGPLLPGRYLAVAFAEGTIASRTVAFTNFDAFVKLATPFTIEPEGRGARIHLTLSRPPFIRR